MNSEQIKGKLMRLHGEMKREWGKLTDDDLTEAAGDLEKIIGRIRERSGKDRATVERWFRDRGLF